MAKHELWELRQWQALPISVKIRITQERIRNWVNEFGEDGVYISFSGDKDSTVLLDIVRKMYPNVKAVFIDTGLEYPEIREFVKSFDNVDWVKPKMNFRQVIEKYGYPFISKEVSECVDGARKYIRILTDGQTDAPYNQFFRKLCGQGEYAKFNTSTIQSTENPVGLMSIAEKANARLKILMGIYPNRKDGIEIGGRSAYSQERYKFFLDAPFNISSNCCKVMKKQPAHEYTQKTGRKPMTAQMASESRLRTQQWLNNGCNGFDMKSPVSNPMAFWTEQDVLLYIKENNLPISKVYGEVVIDYDAEGQPEGQMNMFDLGMFDADRRLLKTTGCNRTGCMFCGYGCHLEKSPNRFERMKETHPKQYDYIMRPAEKGGLNYKEIIDWINEHGNMNIKY